MVPWEVLRQPQEIEDAIRHGSDMWIKTRSDTSRGIRMSTNHIQEVVSKQWSVISHGRIHRLIISFTPATTF